MAVTYSEGSKKPWIVRNRVKIGEKSHRTATQFVRKKDADAHDLKEKGEIRDGVHVPENATVTVAEAGDYWITTAKGDKLRRSTINQYEQHLRLHINPFIGGTRLTKLTVPMLRAYEDRLREEGRSTSLIRKVLVSVSSLLSDAQDRGLINRNVARERKPNRQKAQDRPIKKMGVDIPYPHEVTLIINGVQGRWRPLLLTAIFTGLRAGELLGLRWIDVDLEARALQVRQTIDPWRTVNPPKTKKSERSIQLTPQLVNTLREWKLACPKGPMGLVFPNGKGNPEHHNNILNRGLKPLMIRLGLCDTIEGKVVPRYSGLHCFRHFYASWCLNRREEGGLGLPYKSVQARMGHSTLAMTVDTYSHLFPERHDDELLAAGEKALWGI